MVRRIVEDHSGVHDPVYDGFDCPPAMAPIKLSWQEVAEAGQRAAH